MGLRGSSSGWCQKQLILSTGQARGQGGYLPCTSQPCYPLIHQGEGSPIEGRMGNIGSQSLSEPTAEDPFRFRLVGFGFVSSSSEALLEPDSSSALGG